METKPMAQVMQTVMTSVAASQELSTMASNTSTTSLQELELRKAEIEHKRAFLQMFRRWEILFKRKDSDEPAAKWLVAEYYKSLGQLSPAGFEALTECLKERCTFFPTIRECIELIRPPKYSYASPFYSAPAMFLTGSSIPALSDQHSHQGAIE